MLAAVIPLVPIGTALLFPSTTSLMSRQSDPRELGTTMGVAQTFAGLARVAAPLLATTAFQRLGHGWPFYIAGGCVALVGVLAFQIQVGPSAAVHRRRRKSEGLMSTDDRLERLERRVEVLETLVRAGARAGGFAEPPASAPARAEVTPPPVGRRPGCGGDSPPAAPFETAPRSPLPPPSPAATPPRPRSAPHRPSVSSGIDERWIGQRVFLAVGVVALLMATGYLLKLSFERGWISPIMRCAGGVALGVVVGGIGWRLHERYRTYGAALIGAGGGIIYLCVWAACQLYEVIPPTTGIVGLALVSVALAMIAFAINVEALGTAAALGAFMAPVLLGRNEANANLLLLYLASMAAGLGLVAARRGWRLTMLVVARELFRRGNRGGGGARAAIGPAGVRSAGRDGRALRGPQGAVVGDEAAHLQRGLAPDRRRQRADDRALAGARRRDSFSPRRCGGTP